MGKSVRKKAVVKIRGHLYKIYRRLIRRIQKQDLTNGRDIRDPKEIINDWDYIDYISKCEYMDSECYCLKAYGRKKCLEK